MLITVTQEDINKGKPRSHRECPVALAITRTMGKGTSVCHKDAYVDGNGLYFFGDEVSRFIADFDAENPVKPLQFELSAS